MKKRWVAALGVAMMVLFAAGCDNGLTAAMGAVISGQQEEQNPGQEEQNPVAVESVEIIPETITLKPSMEWQLMATVLPSNATDKTVIWSSSAPSVATVSEYGTVTAHEKGTATITAWAGNETAKCQVTVKNILVAVESVTLDEPTLTLTLGDKATLKATVLPENADDNTVTWSSSADPAVATVDDDGTVTAVRIGKTTITAQAGNHTATCQVTVSMKDFNIDDKGMLTEYTGTDTDVKIPDGVTSIGYRVFYGRTNLASVTIPASVTSIGISAFNGCTSLAEVAIPDGVTSIGDYAFIGCESLMSVTIPASVKSIGEYAFNGCASLTEVRIPEGVTSIGKFAFNYCESLTDVTIPASVKSIEDCAFCGRDKITVTYQGSLVQWCALNGSYYLLWCAEHVIIDGEDLKQEKNLVIPEGVTSIGDCAFQFCDNLTKVTIPEGVTSIGSNAFYGCWSLESVDIPGSVTEIGGSAFCGVGGSFTVTYGGTKNQWGKIVKHSDSFLSMGTITGKDGVTFTVNLNGDIIE